MKTLTRRLAQSSALGMLLLGTTLVGVAEAAPIACGQTITQSTTLESDVGPCSQGITIAADNVVLDLNGHSVLGTAEEGEGPGITFDGTTGSTVRGDGRVAFFDAGIYLTGGGGNTVERVVVADNHKSFQPAFGDGIILEGSSDNRIANNVVRRNGPYDGIGLIFGASSNTITRNVVEDNAIPVTDSEGNPVQMQDHGIRIEGPDSSNNIVSANVVRRSGLDGISAFRAEVQNLDNVITGNVVEANGFHQLEQRRGNGIVLFGAIGDPATWADRNTVRGNVVLGNAANGIRVESRLNQILGNQSRDNAQAALGDAFDLLDVNPNCDQNTWRANTFGTAEPACTRS